MDEPALAAIAERMEARGSHPFIAGAIDDYMAGLVQSPANSLIEIGAAPGPLRGPLRAGPRCRVLSPPSISVRT